MATGITPFVSTKETTNYARLCRLLVDVGLQALRDTFDRIHPPGSLHVVLTSPAVQGTLNSLFTGRRKVLNSTQWGLLYPLHSPPTSASFDITLLTVLLRNICGLASPASGWDSLPAATDTNTEDDIARVKYYRNTLYGHATKASIDDASFNAYWSEIRAALVRLGGAGYGPLIDSLKTDCMDPDCEKQYRLQLLEEWKEDDDNIKVRLEDMKDDISQKLVQVSSEIMESVKEKLDSQGQVHIKEKLERMKSEIESVSEKLNSHFGTATNKTKEEGSFCVHQERKKRWEEMENGLDSYLDYISQKLVQVSSELMESKKEELDSQGQDNFSEKLDQMKQVVEGIKENLDSHFKETGKEIKGQDYISETLEQMRTEMESMREKLDAVFAATTEEIIEKGQLQKDQSQLQAAIQSMKDNIKTGTEQPTDLQQPFRPNPGEGPEAKDLKIDQIYVNVIIHEGRLRYDFPTNRWEQLKVYPLPNTNKANPVRPQDLIDAPHKTVLVVGRPGIGKTMMSTKLLRAWASNDAKLQNQFEVALLLKFRHLNNETDLNLHELLARSEAVESLDGEVWTYIKENPTKVLLIFDGIDEFAARSAIANDESKYKNTVEEKMPVYSLYSKLASGKLLRGATIITTTRPTAVKFIIRMKFDRTIELLGFTSEQVEEYVEKFTEDDHNDDAKETIWQHICSNLNIFSLCYIPVNCFIICHCLLQIINISTDAARKLPSKITDIYSMNIKIFFFKHGNRHEKYSRSTTDLATYIYKTFDDLQPENELVFQRLGEMAFNGIREGRLIFESREVGELDDCGLLHRLPDVKPRTLSQPPKAQFCFTHLTVQEFFAAKHLTDTLKKEDLRRFVADHIYHGTWQVVMQFVAGLLEPDADREMSNIDIFADLLPMSKKVVGTWISWPANATDRDLALKLCKCLDEFDVEKQNSVQRKTAEIGFNAVDFTNCGLTPVDCGAVMHFVKNTKGLEYLNFHENRIGSLGCRAIRDTLKDVNCKLTTLYLRSNNIGEQGAGYLCDALKDINCKLTTLYLSGNNIGEQGVAYLCDALKDVNCKLTTLDLRHNFTGKQGAAYLRNALKDVNCKLTTLYLSENYTREQGAAYMCDALKDVNCKLTTLELNFNIIRRQGAAYLCEALKDVNCKLAMLYLRDNNIEKQGAAYLCDALKDVNCKLTTLDLSINNIGEEGAAYLCDALKDANCELTTLDLSVNNIGYQGSAYLCDALKDVNCKLTTLDLSRNNIGEQGAAYLCDALKDVNCKLTTLDLSRNSIGWQVTAQLDDSLSDANCKVWW